MIKELETEGVAGERKKHTKRREVFNRLLTSLRTKSLPTKVVDAINQSVDRVNASSKNQKEAYKLLYKERNAIVKLVEKETKLVPKNYYRNKWMALGIAFGVPFGVAFGTALGNMAFIGVGMPIGMAIGIAIGAEKDNQAAKEGNQLDVELH